MFRKLGKLSFWLTLVSIIFWSGVVYHILSAQPIERLPAGYPATSVECKSLWAASVPYEVVRKDAEKYCDSYYAIMGDRTAPVLTRLYERTANRIAWQLIDEYLASYPLQPGESIGGPEILAKMGTERVLQIAYESVAKASDPSALSRRANARCLLDKVRMVRSQEELDALPQKCARH